MTDKQYQKAVDKLIPEATRHTNEKVQVSDFKNTSEYNEAWTKAFLNKMTELKKEFGLGMYKKYAQTRSIMVGIDPDLKKNGFAIWEKRMRSLKLMDGSFFEVMDWLIEIHETPNVKLKVFVEAGWLNKVSNFHPAQGPKQREKIAKNVGENHAVGKLLIEFCKLKGMDVKAVKPNKNSMTKLDRKEFKKITGYSYNTNQEKRDAGMLVFAR